MSFNSLGSGGNFYKRMMSLKVKKTGSKKKRRKTKKARKVVANTKSKKSFLFIFSGTDAGFFSDHKQQVQYFKNKLRGLSKNKLQKLHKRIEHAVEFLFDESGHHEKIEKFTALTQTFIELKLKESDSKISALRETIKHRLASMSDPSLIRNSSRRRYIEMEGKPAPIREFSEAYFSDIIEQYESLICSDIIIPSAKLRIGHSFVSEVITELLEK